MSWGYRITILYIGFVGIIVTLVTISSRNKEELVSKDYYAQELAYQDRLTAINNEKQLTTSIQHAVTSEGVLLNLPQGITSGKITFFCPSDSRKDKVFKMEAGSNRQLIPFSQLAQGVYKMQLSWQSGNTSFYKEEIITYR